MSYLKWERLKIIMFELIQSFIFRESGNFIYFFLFFIDYAITVVPIFLPFVALHPALPSPSGDPPHFVYVHGSCI